MDEKDKDQATETPEAEIRESDIKETEEVEHNGETYQVATLTDGKLVIEVPKGLDEEEAEKFVSAIQEKSKTVGSYYKKLQELRQEQQNPAWIKFKEAYEKGELTDEDTPAKEKTAGEPAENQPTEEPIWKYLGLKSEDDLEDYIADYPLKYAKALEQRSKEAVAANVQAELKRAEDEVNRKAAEIALESTIKGAGHDPAEVRAYARFNSMPYGERAYELYRLEHAPKVDPVIEARIKAQREQVTFIDRGTRSRVFQSDLDTTDLRSLTREQLEARRKHFTSLATGH